MRWDGWNSGATFRMCLTTPMKQVSVSSDSELIVTARWFHGRAIRSFQSSANSTRAARAFSKLLTFPLLLLAFDSRFCLEVKSLESKTYTASLSLTDVLSLTDSLTDTSWSGFFLSLTDSLTDENIEACASVRQCEQCGS